MKDNGVTVFKNPKGVSPLHPLPLRATSSFCYCSGSGIDHRRVHLFYELPGNKRGVCAVQASIAANTYVVSGPSDERSASLLPSCLRACALASSPQLMPAGDLQHGRCWQRSRVPHLP